MAEWPLRRLRTAPSWPWRVLLWWVADQVSATLPPPAAGVGALVVDSPLKDQTGQQPAWAKQGWLNAGAPSSVGRHRVVVRRHRGSSRLPVDGELVRRTAAPRSRSEHRRLRWVVVRLRRPAWAAMGVVVAEAALASEANLPLLHRRGDPLVMAWARTWGCANGQALHDRVPHGPKQQDRRGWVPLEEPGRRRTSGTSTKRGCLRPSGGVPMVVSTPRRNAGPPPTHILVTTSPPGPPARASTWSAGGGLWTA
ncbi:MAG: hypothetical protein M3361_10480 [Candidatus Tectomicrobia bacterium]|nr:hypothetical protein [Candidatus Tectomicrobia bacterium]